MAKSPTYASHARIGCGGTRSTRCRFRAEGDGATWPCYARQAGGNGVHAIRGATSVAANTREAILTAGRALLEQMVARNDLAIGDVVAIWLTLTPDLNQAFPAEAARQLGWESVPLLCMQEIPVPGAEPRVLRALMLVQSAAAPAAVRHVYQGGARRLRPDLSEE